VATTITTEDPEVEAKKVNMATEEEVTNNTK
jgi:hypothetical protein